MADPILLTEEFVLQTSRNVFLTGRAGTGKTTLLKSIISKTNKKNVIVAPTGVAAINAGGVTIHSLFQLPPKTFIPKGDQAPDPNCISQMQLAATQKLRSQQRKVLQELELLIIDEISMVRADMLDAIDFTLKRIRKSPFPFGGVQLLVIGDLFQLSPVVKESDNYILRRYYNSNYFFDSLAWNQSTSITIELTKIHRQTDSIFINILNNIRTGEKLESDLEILNEQYAEDIADENLLRLTTHNFKADQINKQKMLNLPSRLKKLKAKISGKFYENSYPVDEILEMKEGAQVMFIKNHKEGLYYNGLIGTIIKISDDIVEVSPSDGSQSILASPEEWKNTRYEVDKAGNIKQDDLGTFTQFPFKPAWAVTVHKSQGLTFDALILDLEDSFASGQLYVALSRCKTLKGLHLTSKIKLQNIIVDQKIIQYYKENEVGITAQEELDKAKKEYGDLLLKRNFDFNKIQSSIDEINHLLDDKDFEKKLAIKKWVKKLNKELTNIQNIANKFSAQLDHLFDQGDENILLQRIEKSISYFSEELHNKLIINIIGEIKQYEKVSKYKTYTNRLYSLRDQVWTNIEKLYELKYNNQPIYTGKEAFKQEKYFDGESANKGLKKASHDITLELWNQGYTLEEIAKAREIKTGSIESHLNKLLNENKVQIKDLIFEERLLKLAHYFSHDHNESLTDIIKKVPFDTTFGELRWVQTYLKKKDKNA